MKRKIGKRAYGIPAPLKRVYDEYEKEKKFGGRTWGKSAVGKRPSPPKWDD